MSGQLMIDKLFNGHQPEYRTKLSTQPQYVYRNDKIFMSNSFDVKWMKISKPNSFIVPRKI